MSPMTSRVCVPYRTAGFTVMSTLDPYLRYRGAPWATVEFRLFSSSGQSHALSDRRRNSAPQDVLKHANKTLLKSSGKAVSQVKAQLTEARQTLDDALAPYDTDRYEVEIEDLRLKCSSVINEAQATCLESHLCRSIQKETKEERKTGAEKYLGIFAAVKKEMVHDALWSTARGYLD
jgi:hypothetical protein